MERGIEVTKVDFQRSGLDNQERTMPRTEIGHSRREVGHSTSRRHCLPRPVAMRPDGKQSTSLSP